MVAVRSKAYVSARQYLDQERQAEYRSEYWDGEIVGMAGASRSHNRITRNLTRWLTALLEGSGCEAFATETRVRVQECSAYFYPDMLIVCGDIQADEADVDTILNPTVLMEVLSPSTEAVDRGKKLTCYRTLPSLQTYVLIAQDTPRIDLYERQTDDRWMLSTLTGLNGRLVLEAVAVTLPLMDIYRNVELPSAVLSQEEPPFPA